MANAVRIYFVLDAGKVEMYKGRDEVNWKYCDQFTDADEALRAYRTCKGYPVIHFHLNTEWDDGTRTRVSVFDGGHLEQLVDGR